MKEIWIENGKGRTRGVEFPCIKCGEKIWVRKCRLESHKKVCHPCTNKEKAIPLLRKFAGWNKGKKDENAVSKHPDYERKRALTSRTRRKISIVIEKGDECSICKKRYPIACYAFHHREPKEKKFTLGKWIRRNIPKEEIEKCDLVCHNCHSILHYGSTMAQGGDYPLRCKS
jgi:hypothetical protein